MLSPLPQVTRCENQDWDENEDLYALCSAIFGTEDGDNMEWRDMGSIEDWDQVRSCMRFMQMHGSVPSPGLTPWRQGAPL